MAVIAIILIVIALLALEFGVTAGILAMICWAFGLAFSWKIAFGVWLVLALLSMFLKSSSKS